MIDSSSDDEVVRDVDPLDGYRSPRQLVIIVTIALSVCVIALIAAMIAKSAAWQLTTDLKRGHHVPQFRMELVHARLELADQVLVGILWATVILFFVAIYRFAANARALTRGRVSAPASAVVWYFIPVLNLFMPYLVLQKIWRASGPFGGRWPEGASSVLLRRWWALWLMSIALVGTERYLRLQIASLSNLQMVFGIAFARSAANLALAATSMLFVLRLAKMQEGRYAHLRASASKSCLGCGEVLRPYDAVCPVCGREASGGRQPSEFVPH